MKTLWHDIKARFKKRLVYYVRHESITVRMARQWRFRLTLPGNIMFLGWVFSTMFGVYSLDMPVYLAVCAWTALPVISFCVGMLWRSRVVLQGESPGKAIAGQQLTLTWQARNNTRRPVYDLCLGLFNLPNALAQTDRDVVSVPCLGARDTTESTGLVQMNLLPKRRGLYEMPPLTAYSTFPFNLFRTRAGTAPLKPLLVLPSFSPLTDISVPTGMRYQPGGIALTSKVGESMEYIGNREYQYGDSLRHIDHRSWARLAKPVVREYQEEYFHRIALIVDTFVPGKRPVPPAGFPDLEAAISLSAAVADALSRGEYILDIFAAGPELYVFRAGRHTAHFENVLEILACVEPCRENPFQTITPAIEEELHNISSVICVFLDWDKSRELLVQSAVESGCAVKLIIVRAGDTTLPLASADQWTRDVHVFPPEAARNTGIERL